MSLAQNRIPCDDCNSKRVHFHCWFPPICLSVSSKDCRISTENEFISEKVRISIGHMFNLTNTIPKTLFLLLMSSSSSTKGTKYVPPHLRNSQSSGGGNDSRNSGGRGYGNDRRHSDNRRGSYGDDRRGSYGGNNSGRGGGQPRRNSRWNDADIGNDRRGSYGGRGGYDRRGSSYARKNERGFHGDMQPDPRLERQLFESEHQTTGINFDNYDKIPVEVSGENAPEPIDTYSVETIGEDLFRNTQLCGYSRPTPVQKYSCPIGSAGRDLMACAQTGSGKTAGFLFPIIMAMLRNGGSDSPENGRRQVYPEALIMAPTRELAQQIFDEARRFTYTTGIATVCIYGGAEVREQLRQIERGCDLLVATPGRLVDLIERGRLGMENIKFLVLDEADRMLDMGFGKYKDTT